MLRVCHLLYPKTWWPELRCDQNIPKCYVREAGSLVETALKEDFVLFRESPKHGEAGIPSVQLRSMNWVTFNGSLSSDYLKSTVIMLLKSWAAWQDHLTVFFSVTLEFSTSERGLSVVHNLEDGSCVIYNICVSGKEMQASLLINKHTCVRTILGRPLFPEELISNIGKSWPSKTDLCFSVLMEVSAIWRLISGCSERQQAFGWPFCTVVPGYCKNSYKSSVNTWKDNVFGGQKTNLLKDGKRDEETALHSSWIFKLSWEEFQSDQITSEKQVLHAVSKFGCRKRGEYIYLCQNMDLPPWTIALKKVIATPKYRIHFSFLYLVILCPYLDCTGANLHYCNITLYGGVHNI